MRNKISLWLVWAIIPPILLIFSTPVRAETYIDESNISNDPVWGLEGSPYILSDDIMVPYGHSLTLQSGAVIKADPNLGRKPTIYVYGEFNSYGAKIEDGIWGVTVDHGSTTIDRSRFEMPYGLDLISTTAHISSSTFSGAVRAIRSIESDVHVKSSEIYGNDIGLLSESSGDIFLMSRDVPVETGGIGNALEGMSHIVVNDSSFSNNTSFDIDNASFDIVDARNNWWGSAEGPAMIGLQDDIAAIPQKIRGDVVFSPWLNYDPLFGNGWGDDGEGGGDDENLRKCCSSVIFIPGLQASSLYKQEPGTLFGINTNTLWVPNRSADVEALYMDQYGSSTDKDVYSGDPVGKALGLYGVYDKFMKFLSALSTSTRDVTNDVEADRSSLIREWKPFGYDWRKSVNEVAVYEEKKATTTISLPQLVMEMAPRSATGKVTLIAHSNGGLVTKNLVASLEKEGHAGLIDKVILVASPLLGTPQAIAGLLHGDNQSIAHGLILSTSVARELGKNMPSAYSLLPSQKYFEQISGPTVSLDWASTSAGHDFQSSFISGLFDGRYDPELGDTSLPIRGNARLMSMADSMRDGIDNYRWPAGIETWAIVGDNVVTTQSVAYSKSTRCRKIFGIEIYCSDYVSHTNVATSSGDGTVISGSAKYGADNVVFADLYKISKNEDKNFVHSNILESESVEEVIKKIIEGDREGLRIMTAITVGDYATSSQVKHILVGLESDSAELQVRDMSGKRTQLLEAPLSDGSLDNMMSASSTGRGAFIRAFDDEIIGSKLSLSDNPALGIYETRIYLPVEITSSSTTPSIGNATTTYIVQMLGDSFGTATLSIGDHYVEQNITTSSSVKIVEIPMTPFTVASTTIEITSNAINSNSTSTSPVINISSVQVDLDGDGVKDLEIDPSPTATITATTSISSSFLSVLKKMIRESSIQKSKTNNLLQRLNNIEKFIVKDKFKKSVRRLNGIVDKISRWKHLEKSGLTDKDREELIIMIEAYLKYIESVLD